MGEGSELKCLLCRCEDPCLDSQKVHKVRYREIKDRGNPRRPWAGRPGISRDFVSNKVKGENQHLGLSSDLYIHTMAHTHVYQYTHTHTHNERRNILIIIMSLYFLIISY